NASFTRLWYPGGRLSIQLSVPSRLRERTRPLSLIAATTTAGVDSVSFFTGGNDSAVSLVSCFTLFKRHTHQPVTATKKRIRAVLIASAALNEEKKSTGC